MVVGAVNPCPCGHYGHPTIACRCTPAERRRYVTRLSGPLLDRIDLHVAVPRLAFEELDGPGGECSAAVRKRVVQARQRQQQRSGVLNLGVDGIMTDRPTVLKQVFTDRGQWVDPV